MFFRSQTFTVRSSLPETTLSPTVNTAEVTVLPREGRGSEPRHEVPVHTAQQTPNPATPGPVGWAGRQGCEHHESPTPLTGPPTNPCQHTGSPLTSPRQPHLVPAVEQGEAPRQDGPDRQDPPKSLKQTIIRPPQLRLSDNSIRALEKNSFQQQKTI